jgi:hypothetical protein
MLSLFANSALLKRFLTLMGLFPMILIFIEKAETAGGSGPQKQQQVLDAVQQLIDELTQHQFLPAEMQEDVQKTAAELIDISIRVYNKAGFFTKGTWAV